MPTMARTPRTAERLRACAPRLRAVAFAVAIALALTLPLGLPLSACGGGAGAAHPVRPLPSYSGHAVDLFDDAIEPLAVGFHLDAYRGTPRSDNLLRERTQVGDAVVRARVTTVSSKEEDRGRSWQLGMHTVDRLGGTGPLDPDFALRVGPSDASAGIVRTFESHLIGQTFVAFVREFIRPGGDPELHFHLGPDSKDELDAVNAAVLLERVR
jgi:hypothetical protein